jgi:ribonuclease R
MEFSIATLLSNFTDDKLVAPKVLEKKLGCQDEESLKKLEIVLEALEKIGILVKERGKYKRLQEENVVEAKLRCSSKGFCFAIQDTEQSEDIYIRESHLSNAWNGDRVLVRITKEGSRRRSPEGEVRLILERANPSVLARVKSTESGFTAVPLDDRLLFELNLQPHSENLENAVDHLVHVEVLRYPIAQNPPLGKVARVLGSDAEAADEKEIVCCKHDLRRAFPLEVLKAAEALPKKLGKTSERLDLGHLFTVTFSPQSPGDDNQAAIVENAFTLEKNATGAWQLGIHITDAAHYVRPDTALDREAKGRGTASYLGDTCLPLLPDALTSLCSLVPGEARLAVSILLTLDDSGQVVEFEIQPTLIQVDRQLSYQQLQSILDAKPTEETAANSLDLAPEIVEMLKQILDLSVAVRVQRLQRGAFELKLPEPVSLFPDEGRLGAVTVSVAEPDVSTSSPLARTLLKELTILANQAVGSHLLALALPGIYCLQKAPHPDELEDLLKLASHLQINWQLEQEDEVRPSDFQRFIQLCGESDASGVLNYLLKSALKPFGYSKTPGPHFGLAYGTGYTHCGSPLQRYADLLGQRVLTVMFEKGRDRRSTKAKDSVNLRHSSCHGQINWNVLPPSIAEDLESLLTSVIPHLNEREKIAMDAEADFIGLKKAEMVKERTGEVFQGMITGVQSYGFFVEIEDLLVEGLVHVSSLKDDWYEFRSRHACLVGRKNRIAYRLGDRVEVQVKSVDYYRQQIDLVTVGGGSEANNEDMETEE